MQARERHRETVAARVRPVRGGVSLGAILTGVVVAFGAFFLLSALIAGTLVASGIQELSPTTADGVEVGIGVGIGIVVAQFLAYLWGGYTAGRMARGAGLANGFLVPIIAIVIAIIVAAIAAASGATANLNVPFGATRFPTEENLVFTWGTGLGIAALAVMFAGGLLGGWLGSRWHSKLERDAMEQRDVETRHTTPATAPAHATDDATRPAEERTIRKPGDTRATSTAPNDRATQRQS